MLRNIGWVINGGLAAVLIAVSVINYFLNEANEAFSHFDEAAVAYGVEVNALDVLLLDTLLGTIVSDEDVARCKINENSILIQVKEVQSQLFLLDEATRGAFEKESAAPFSNPERLDLYYATYSQLAQAKNILSEIEVAHWELVSRCVITPEGIPA